MARRFLVSRLSSLGDVVCCLPAASALKSGEPDAHVTWVVDPRFADVVRACAAVDETVCARPRFRWDSLPRFDGPFDVALDLQGLIKSAAATLHASVERRVGYHWQREGAGLFSRKILPDPTSAHIVDQYVDVARAVGGAADRADFGLRANADAVESVRTKLAARGVAGRFVAINPGSAWASKRWPVERFASVVSALGDEGVAAVSIGGAGAEDRTISDELVAACDRKPVAMTGETSVAELIALISLATAHLGGDTGSTHIAAALGIPAVGLYATTRPERSCPYGQIKRCLHDARGLEFISDDAVVAKVMEAVA